MDAIAGKVVAITGAGSGIGEAVAVHLAGRGASVVLGARRADRLAAVAGRIEAACGRVAYAATDVRRLAEVQALVDLAVSRFGRLDAIVNNAGVSKIGPLDQVRVADWDEMIDVNLRGTLHGIAAALPVFRRQGSGHVINVVSTSGLKIVPTQGVYAATKNAVRTITEALRQEAGPHLRVTGISPGFVRTDLPATIDDPATRAAIERRMADIAIPPEAIARAVAFAMEQPPDVDVGDIVVRPTAQD